MNRATRTRDALSRATDMVDTALCDLDIIHRDDLLDHVIGSGAFNATEEKDLERVWPEHYPEYVHGMQSTAERLR